MTMVVLTLPLYTVAFLDDGERQWVREWFGTRPAWVVWQGPAWVP